MDNKMTLGQYLLQIRKRKGMSTRQLAKEIGYSFGYISAVENGTKKNPSLKFIKNYVSRLGATQKEIETNLLEIQNLTNNEYNFGIIEINSEEDEENSLFNAFSIIQSPYNYSEMEYELDENGKEDKKKIKTETFKSFNFPINDLHYHLTNDHNVKFFKLIKITDDDRYFIDKFIHEYLYNKYNTLKIEFEENLFDEDKENYTEYLNDLNEIINHLDNYKL
ncbi:helix-turn-helix domain-containing protein [Macrococcoides bohemicum]|uniref:helix-turn-helix domain-containing protein n=1 Tax=Macrococcoides bohemicum TaxID=1903056 RepID=UPI000BB59716|nr:helix-turn-helix domain-containing protein [Macrococcus sp. IME1552]ATD30554.1 hypothetical protein BHM04_04895 [Macrococcus sp. IME1552]